MIYIDLNQVDRDALARVLVKALGSYAKGDVAHYRNRLNDDDYVALCLGNRHITAAYNKECS